MSFPDEDCNREFFKGGGPYQPIAWTIILFLDPSDELNLWKKLGFTLK